MNRSSLFCFVALAQGMGIDSFAFLHPRSMNPKLCHQWPLVACSARPHVIFKVQLSVTSKHSDVKLPAKRFKHPSRI